MSGGLHLVELETLGIGADFRAVEGILNGVDQLIAIADGLRRRAFENLTRLHALFLQRRQTSREDRFGNRVRRNAKVQRIGAGPLARPLLPRGVENVIDQVINLSKVSVIQEAWIEGIYPIGKGLGAGSVRHTPRVTGH